MIVYADGVEARVGDQVDYDGEPSVVEATIDTPEQCAEWGVAEPGLLLTNAVFGSVFVHAASPCWASVLFHGRGEG